MKRPLSLTIRIWLAWVSYMPTICVSYFIAWLDRKVRFRLAFPRDVEQLTEQKPWLIKELKAAGALPSDAVIDSCGVRPLDKSIIFRSDAAIIEIKYTDKVGSGILRCFAKFAPTMGTVWNKTIFNLQLNHIKEAWFNQFFVNQDNIPAPRVYVSKVSPLLGHLCLITEQMTDDIEYHTYPYKDFQPAHLDMALHGLATLHAQYWGDHSPRMARVLPIQDIVVYLFDSMVAGKWSISARKVLVKSWITMNQPQTVLHGDSRIGNMMFPSAPDRGRYVMIDWQAARRGRAAFDLAYFLILSLPADQRQLLEPPSIDTYYHSLTGKGVKDYTRTQLEDDYRHGCLCTLVLLSLPMLSGEVSAEGDAALLFVFGMGIWRERLRQRFDDFDYEWMSVQYDMTQQEARNAVAEMIVVIDARLNAVLKGSGSHDTLVDILRRDNIAGEFKV
ncbi:MAG: hypothetical protein JWO03_724 [Bacteroidetes bacterium]|nr:hypothetical protein [Bacteroidota bacterium]